LGKGISASRRQKCSGPSLPFGVSTSRICRLVAAATAISAGSPLLGNYEVMMYLALILMQDRSPRHNLIFRAPMSAIGHANRHVASPSRVRHKASYSPWPLRKKPTSAADNRSRSNDGLDDPKIGRNIEIAWHKKPVITDVEDLAPTIVVRCLCVIWRALNAW
jgi:hypothetical protein